MAKDAKETVSGLLCIGVADGELTPTMKVKRNIVSKKFADQLDALYPD